MAINVIKPPRQEVLMGLARFAELSRCSTGLPDMPLPEAERTFLNVLGFDQPNGDGKYSPFGDEAKAAVRHIRAGFGLSFVASQPGKGVLMHAHDSIECFMAVNGEWKVEWEGAEGVQSIPLHPLDFIAIPVGVERRFECVSAPEGAREALLLGIMQGDSPGAEYSPESIKRMVDAGVLESA